MDGEIDWEGAAFQLVAPRPYSLLDLDPHEPERAELRGAGVAERRIYALYPAEFSMLLPGLTARIERTDPAELIHLNQAQDQVDFILLARERLDGTPDVGGSRMIHWQHIVANDQAQRFDPAYAKLQEVFRAQLRDLQHRQDVASTAADATNVLWHIHRFQAHRHELDAKYVAVADALDARVCAILNTRR